MKKNANHNHNHNHTHNNNNNHTYNNANVVVSAPDFFKEDEIPQKITSIQFGMMGKTEQARVGEFKCVNPGTYARAEVPVEGGLLDFRLGVCDKKHKCATCGEEFLDCPGHWAYIQLNLPVYNLGYNNQILKVLQAICKTCGRLLITDSERAPFLAKMRVKKVDSLNRARVITDLLKLCKKTRICPHCHATNGTVKKNGPTKFAHEKYRIRNAARRAYEPTAEGKELRGACEGAVLYNREVRGLLEGALEDITPLDALRLFRSMTTEDIEALDMDPVHGPPEHFIIETLPVPPVAIRPSVFNNETSLGSTEDDLTALLRKVVHYNNELAYDAQHGPGRLYNNWELIQDLVGLYINSNIPKLYQKASAEEKKKPRSLCTRLKGKQGRFRGNLCGKRVDFSARTVISPDPNLFIWQVGVPIDVAKIMTYPERVTDHNIEYLRHLIENGPDMHPGANYIIYKSTSRKRFLKIPREERVKLAADIKVGDVVERHMRDGDVVLFNRQPSLHRISIMAHVAVILKYKTFRFNECVCTPYNADFDGDEMNLHLPQTEEARTEALELMGVVHNLITPRSGEILVASTQDFLTTGYLLTRKDQFYDKFHFMQICASCGDANERIDLPMPAIIKPYRLFTGKQAIRMIFTPNKDSKTFLNYECSSKTRCDSCKGPSAMYCPCDGFVCFQNSELLSGTLDKSTLGGNKNCIWHVMMREYSPVVAGRCMTRLAKLSARWIADHGFSIGISDVTPSAKLTVEKKRLIEQCMRDCDDLIVSAKTGKLIPSPGLSLNETLENEITGKLSKVRDDEGKMCFNELHYNNSPLIMARCGSKGSAINISQMIACVGQQVVSGTRIPNGFIRRTLPHFPIDAKDPAAKGFVQDSFYDGLTPYEFFFHTMGGREGLVDSAVKTAETGYMQRRLMKALEDLYVHYDNTVRNSDKAVVQLTYGEDGLDPCTMEAPDTPVNFSTTLLNIISTNPAKTEEKRLLPYEITEEVEKYLKKSKINKVPGRFVRDIHKFFGHTKNDGSRTSGLVDTLSGLRKSYGLDPARDAAPATADDPVMLKCVNSINSITTYQLNKFLERCYEKYLIKITEPGTAVGALAGQSIGEPGTQMTLKTFHFAGVASMNVTLGVPRLKEIINAVKNISTPIIYTALENKDELVSAQIVQSRIERTTLEEISESIREVYTPEMCYIEINLDMGLITTMHLEVTSETVKNSILLDKKVHSLKIKSKNIIATKNNNKIMVIPPHGDKTRLFFLLQHLKVFLPKVSISGIANVEKAIINRRKKDAKSDNEDEMVHEIFVESDDLATVMGIPGVDGNNTYSNHVMSVEKVLGIEAARQTIMKEIVTVLSSQCSIDARHTMLVADLMTFKGFVYGITRYGISRMKEGVLMLASFERMTDFLFEAGTHSRKDPINGITESIVTGTPIPLGTGLFKVLHAFPSKETLGVEKRSTILGSIVNK